MIFPSKSPIKFYQYAPVGKKCLLCDREARYVYERTGELLCGRHKQANDEALKQRGVV